MALDLPTLLLLTNSTIKDNIINKVFEEEYYIKTLSNFDEALDLLKYLRPQIIILDEKMFPSSIEDVIKRLKTEQLLKDVPILVITSSLKKTFAKKVIKAGATDLLREPLDEEELAHRILMVKRFQKTHKKMNVMAQMINEMKPPETSRKLSDRLVLDQKVSEAIQSSLESQENLSLLIIEIDDFEKLHKELKGAITKEILLPFEKHLRLMLRKQDIIMRLEMGKFVIILPKTTSKAAEIIAENVQDFLHEHPFEIEDQERKITASIGVSNTSPSQVDPDESIEFLVKIASKCLKEAKLQGNQVVTQFKENSHE